jgi:uncharacterized protein
VIVTARVGDTAIAALEPGKVHEGDDGSVADKQRLAACDERRQEGRMRGQVDDDLERPGLHTEQPVTPIGGDVDQVGQHRSSEAGRAGALPRALARRDAPRAWQSSLARSRSSARDGLVAGSRGPRLRPLRITPRQRPYSDRDMPTTPLQRRLRAALRDALGARDAIAAAAIRSALSAIGNAEAVPAEHPRRVPASSEHFAGATAGLGAAETARRLLTDSDVAAIVAAEISDRRSAAAEYDRLGRADQSARLGAEADVLAALLADC